MILPATYLAVLVLLVVSLFCLGTWINTFKAAGPKWGFELFSMDFSAGALIVVVIAAYTLGTLGSDLPFSDRLLVAGKTNQVLAILSGAVFNLGNMLLLASVSLIGISVAFPLSIGVALIVSGCFHYRADNISYLVGGSVLALITVVLELRAARLREAARPAQKPVLPVAAGQVNPATATVAAASRTAPLKTSSGHSHGNHSIGSQKGPEPKRMSRRSVRGITAGLIGGIALGFFVPILEDCVPGDIGLGPYAGMLLFGIGMFASTFAYNFYFLNITIEGNALTFASYFRGKRKQHLLGLLGGTICISGLLAATLGVQSSGSVDMPKLLSFLIPLLSIPLAVFYGAAFWKEWRVASHSRSAHLLAFVLFLCSLGLFAYGFNVH
ncbi:MAG TPA: hypothetical protein VH302_09355 [Bryobacteraceae bacterium]|nr:hypothetical protein [Bryobacteraceae bacterium]